MKKNTINTQEISHFAKDSANWWDEDGAFAPLHKLNPIRLSYIKKQIEEHKGGVKDLEILDIGCGGGLVCEPLTRLGAKVTGIDGDAQAIDVAKTHASENNLKINYLSGDAANLLQSKKRYDVVLALEVIEHVDNTEEFIQILTKLVKPNGLIILSTLNRTAQSFVLGIVAAEYLLNWVPRGTHSWKKFLKPSEIHVMLHRHNFELSDITGLNYKPLQKQFKLSQKIDVNYFITAKKYSR